MAKSKITTEQCEAVFAEVVEMLGDEDSWHINTEGGKFSIARTVEGGGFKFVYKPLGPSSFIHCCEFLKGILKAQAGITEEEEPEDDDEDEDEAAALLAEEDEDDVKKKPTPAARASQRK